MPIPVVPSYGRVVVLRRTGEDSASFDLTDAHYIFGREPHCDVRIQLASISPEHCRIFRNELGRAMLENISIHGTIINGITLEKGQTYELQHGDIMTVIERSFRFELDHHLCNINDNSTPKKSPRKSTPITTGPSRAKQPTPARLHEIREPTEESSVRSSGIQGSPMRTLRSLGSPVRVPASASPKYALANTAATTPMTPTKSELKEKSRNMTPHEAMSSPRRSFTVTPMKCTTPEQNSRSPVSPRSTRSRSNPSIAAPMTTDLFLSTPIKQLEQLPVAGVATSEFFISTVDVQNIDDAAAIDEPSILEDTEMIVGKLNTPIVTAPTSNVTTTMDIPSTPPPRHSHAHAANPNYSALFPPTPALAAVSRLASAGSTPGTFSPTMATQGTPVGTSPTLATSPISTTLNQIPITTPSRTSNMTSMTPHQTPISKSTLPSTPPPPPTPASSNGRSPRYSVQASAGGSPIVVDKEISGSPKLGKVKFYEIPPLQDNLKVLIEDSRDEEQDAGNFIENNEADCETLSTQNEAKIDDANVFISNGAAFPDAAANKDDGMAIDQNPDDNTSLASVNIVEESVKSAIGTDSMQEANQQNLGETAKGEPPVVEKTMEMMINEESLDDNDSKDQSMDTELIFSSTKAEESQTEGKKVTPMEESLVRANNIAIEEAEMNFLQVEKGVMQPVINVAKAETTTFEAKNCQVETAQSILPLPSETLVTESVGMMDNVVAMTTTSPIEPETSFEELSSNIPRGEATRLLSVQLSQASSTELTSQTSVSVPTTPRRSTRLLAKTPMSASKISTTTSHVAKRAKTPTASVIVEEGVEEEKQSETTSMVPRSTRTPRSARTPITKPKASTQARTTTRKTPAAGKKTPMTAPHNQSKTPSSRRKAVEEEEVDATSPTMNLRAARDRHRKEATSDNTTAVKEIENIPPAMSMVGNVDVEKKTPGRKRPANVSNVMTDTAEEDHGEEDGRRRSSRARTPARIK